MRLKKYENYDILSVLKKAVDRNTQAFHKDINFDAELLKRAAEKPTGTNDRFLWVSRKHGTIFLQEREVYIKDSSSHTVWQFYANNKGENDTFVAYAVEVTGIEDGKVIGNLHEFDYLEHVEAVKQTNFRSAGIDVRFEDGTELNIPYAEFYKDWDELNFEHGSVVYQKHIPNNEMELQAVLTEARTKRDKDCQVVMRKVQNSPTQTQSIQKFGIRDQLARCKEIAAHRQEARRNLLERNPDLLDMRRTAKSRNTVR